MTLAERIARMEAALAERLTARAAMTEGLEALRTRADGGDVTVTDESVATAITERQAYDAGTAALREEITVLRGELLADEAVAVLQRELVPAGAPVIPAQRTYERQVRVAREPAAYDEANRLTCSFFRDAFAAAIGGASREARERLERNEREEAVNAADSVQRATTTGSYAGLVVPQYLVDLAANVLRNGRPMADACTGLPIPEQGMSFLLPRATTGVTAASQATENTAASNTDQVWGNVTVPVASIMGQQQVSRQSLERGTPGIDSLIYMDLAAAYMAELDRQIFVGTGASGQLSGINGTASIYTATLYGAAITVSTYFSKTAGAIAGIAGAGTAITPGYIVMHPRRWGWLTLQVDSAGRPLVVPNGNGPFNALAINVNPGAYGGDGETIGGAGPVIVGTLQGIPIFTDANIPTNLGGGSTEDVQFVFDPRMALLFEDGDGMPRQLKFEQIQATGVAGFGATVTLAAYNYVAFTAGRYPQAFARVGGADATGANGHQAPTY